MILVTLVTLRVAETRLAVTELEQHLESAVTDGLAKGRIPEFEDGLRLYQGSGTSPGFFPDSIRDREPGFYRVVDDGRHYHVLIRDMAAQRYGLMREVPDTRARDRLLRIALVTGWLVALVAAWLYGLLLRRREMHRYGSPP